MKAVRKFSKSTLSTMSSLYGIPFGSRTIPSDSNSSAPGGINDRIWKESTDGLELTRIWNVFVEYRRGLSIWNTEMTTADWFGFHIRFTAIGWHFTELTEKTLRLFWDKYENFPRREYQLMQLKVLTFPHLIQIQRRWMDNYFFHDTFTFNSN